MDDQLKKEALALQDTIVAWRREFHQCPELKMDTPVTSGKIAEKLRELGCEEIRTGIGGNGVSCLIRGGLPGKCLGIRADCDGLPIREETGLPFASVNGNMHACGHDAHTAMALGAAGLLLAHREELRGSVKMIFQPYEEGDGGARAMIADGVLEAPRVDAMIALHTGNLMGPQFTSGDICYHPRMSSFAIRTFFARFIGKATHVATPQLGIDPILPACAAVTQIQALTSRERAPQAPAIVSVSVIRGGTRNNAVPEECYIEGTIRSTTREEQDYYYRRVEQICRCAAEGMRCRVELGQIFDLMPSVNDPAMTEKLVAAAAKVVGRPSVKEIRELTPNGEDFARFAELVPSVYFFHCSAFGDERDYPHHNPRFTVNEETFWSGTAVLAQFALDWQKEDAAAAAFAADF